MQVAALGDFISSVCTVVGETWTSARREQSERGSAQPGFLSIEERERPAGPTSPAATKPRR
jgi:hypothetical protein